uniref:Uncharacterized protein n=1 Tax=Romanomermis culicivorax TaxID=13658 RepID=A0A915J8Z0_ROMCU
MPLNRSQRDANFLHFEIQIFYQIATVRLINDYRQVFEIIKSWHNEYQNTDYYANVIFVSFTSSNVENIFTSLDPKRQTNFPHFGNMFVNTYESSTDELDEKFLAEFLAYCACYRHNQCVFKIKKVTECRFEVGFGRTERCLKNISREILTVPIVPTVHKRLSCYTDVMEDCSLQECMVDCDLKSWFPWTECREKIPGSGNYSRKRVRLFPKAGSSQFTKNCPEEESLPCELTTEKPTTTINATTEKKKEETTEADAYPDDITGDPDQMHLTIPPDEEIAKDARHSHLIFVLGVFLIIFVVSTILGAGVFLFLACRQMARRRYEKSLSFKSGGGGLGKFSWSYKSAPSSGRKSSSSKHRKSKTGMTNNRYRRRCRSFRTDENRRRPF